jgi:hypothetical protein
MSGIQRPADVVGVFIDNPIRWRFDDAAPFMRYVRRVFLSVVT